MSAQVVETRAAKVAVASGLSMGLSMVLQLVSVPVCLRFWGKETYGLWLALLALANLVRTLESGFTAYVGNELNLQYHRDQQELRRTMASAVWGAVVVAALELLGGALIVFSGALADLLGVPEEVAREARAGLAFAVLLIGFAATAPYLGVVNRLLVPAGMLHQATWWFMGLQIMQSVSLVGAAALECSLTEAAVLFAAALTAIHLASAIYIARKLPGFFPWWKRPSRTHGFRDLFRSTVMTGANLLMQAGTNGVVMVVSGGLGAAAVPAFTTVRTLASLWTTLGNVLTTPLLPEVVRYHAQNDAKKLVAALEAHWLIANCLVNLSILACLPFFDDLYRIWTGGRVLLEPALLRALLLAVVVGTPGALIVQYLVGINDLRALTAIHAVRGLVPLAAGIALLPSLGVVGIGVGVVLGELLGPVLLGGLYFRRQLHRAERVETPSWQPIAMGTSIAAAFLVAQMIRTPHFGPAYGAALVGVAATVVWGWRGMSAEVRDRALRLLRLRSA